MKRSEKILLASFVYIFIAILIYNYMHSHDMSKNDIPAELLMYVLVFAGTGGIFDYIHSSSIFDDN